LRGRRFLACLMTDLRFQEGCFARRRGTAKGVRAVAKPPQLGADPPINGWF